MCAASTLISASLSRGAAAPSLPMNSISSTWLRSIRGRGQRTPQCQSRLRLRNSFSAQALTIFRGLCLA